MATISENAAIAVLQSQNQTGSGTAGWYVSGSTDIQLSAGDTIELYSQANGGATIGVGTGPIATYLCGHLISKT